MAETALVAKNVDLGLVAGVYGGVDSAAAGFYQASDETNGNKVRNAGRLLLHVKNTDASAHTITVKTQKNCEQGHSHDVVVSVPATGERMIGGLLMSEFNDVNGDILIAWSAGSDTFMTVAPANLVQDGR